MIGCSPIFCFGYRYRFKVQSWHRFFARNAGSAQRNFNANDLAAFVQTFEYDNLLTRYLTGKYHGACDPSDADRAIHQLERMDLIGFVEDIRPFFSELGVLC